MGWNGKKNGELLKLLLENQFDVLMTFDRNMQYQQNFKKYSIGVLVLNAQDNTYPTLRGLVGNIKEILNKKIQSGPIEIKAYV